MPLSSPAAGLSDTPTPSKSNKKRRFYSAQGNTGTPSKKTRRAKKAPDGDASMADAPLLPSEPKPNWQDEIGTPLQWLELKKRSNKFDITDPWWQNMFIKHAGQTVEKSVNRLNGQGVLDAGDISKQYQSAWQNDDAGLDPNIALEPKTSTVQPSGNQHELLNDITSLLEEGRIWADELEQHHKANVVKETDGEDVDSDKTKVSGMATVIEPTQEHVDILAEQDRWADDPDLQRDNIEESLKYLRIPIPTSDGQTQGLKMPEMRPGVSLQSYQPVAANAMLDAFNDPLLIGHLNADDVGLGKTVETIAFLLRVSDFIDRLWKLSSGC